MNTDFIKGVVVPILTPIDAEERIHERKLREQVDYVIEGGVLGILAFGSNGEFYVITCTLRPLQRRFPKSRCFCITIPGGWDIPCPAIWWNGWPMRWTTLWG